jgi:hypothetical protein
MKFSLFILLFCFLGVTATPLYTDVVDLMAMKKQEDERRKKLAKSKLVINDTNVNTVSAGDKKYGFVQMESESTSGTGSEIIAPPTEPTDNKSQEDKTKQADFWIKQKTDLEERIAKLKTDIESAQLELNKLWSDFYIKNVASEQDAIRQQIAQKTNEMEQKKLFLSQSEAQLEELFEKARKAGVPPGWLR